MKRALGDTLASLVFFTLVAGFSEWAIAGLEFAQVVRARLAAAPALIVTGRPYGLWRDWLMARTDARRSSALRRNVVDTVAFISFQVPVYLAILLWVDATPAQISAALTSAIALMLLLSRPFGIYPDWVRRLAGTAPGTRR